MLTRTSSSTLYNLRNGIPEKRRRREMSSGRRRSRHDLHLIFLFFKIQNSFPPPRPRLPSTHLSSLLFYISCGCWSSLLFWVWVGSPAPAAPGGESFFLGGEEEREEYGGRLVWAEGSNWLLGWGGINEMAAVASPLG